MPFYISQGKIPKKRHTAFKKDDGNIYYEELVSRGGFSSIYSNLYHLNRPTKIKQVGNLERIELIHLAKQHRHRHIITSKIQNSGDILRSRTPLFFNDDIIISIANVNKSMDYFYRNGMGDELLYIQSGSGNIISNLGDLECNPGEYIVIPRGIIWQLVPNGTLKTLVIDSSGPIETPNRYRNSFGQLLEYSPFCERDIKVPKLQDPKDEAGEFLVKTKISTGIQEYSYASHPFDIIGWDGYYFPWSFSIDDFEPIVGSIHQPPPVHQTFQAPGFVVCSFVPRLFDFHPDAIPSPYPHSNLDSDEVIYYSKGEFMSREGIQSESITLHPMGLPHGPQPGKYKSSIGKARTDELAVMIDTFTSLNITGVARKIDDEDYPLSWID
jgi:homogentisate 1,2-dioxygenase